MSLQEHPAAAIGVGHTEIPREAKHSRLWYQIHRLNEVSIRLEEFLSRINNPPSASLRDKAPAPALEEVPLSEVLNGGPDHIAGYIDTINERIDMIERELFG
jgi:hypothetical protein